MISLSENSINVKNYININKEKYNKEQLFVLQTITQKDANKEELKALINPLLSSKLLGVTKLMINKGLSEAELKLFANPLHSFGKISNLRLILLKKPTENVFKYFAESKVSNEQLTFVRENIFLKLKNKDIESLIQILLKKEYSNKSIISIKDMYLNDIDFKDLQIITDKITNDLQIKQIELMIKDKIPMTLITELVDLNWEAIAQLRLYYMSGASAEDVVKIKHLKWEDIHEFRKKK